MARLVALGDAHLGRTHLAHVRDEQGRNVREEDFLRSFAWAVDETLRLEPDGFLWLGDVFDHARPTYRTFAHVLAGLQKLTDAGLPGVAISGNHDTPRIRGTGSPYDALERVFPSVTFAWRMQALSVELGGALVHAVPQTLSVEDLRTQLDAAAGATKGGLVNVLLAHVALTSLPARAWGDINELQIEEGAFAKDFDLVVLGHYHAHQRASTRTWYAGSTDTFTFADSPDVPKGVLLIDTDEGTADLLDNPHTRPLTTLSVPASGLSAGELLDAVERAAAGSPPGGIVRVYLQEVDPASFRQVGTQGFQDTVPGALHVQVEPDYGAEALALQAGPTVRSLEQEWTDFVEVQELAGLDRPRVVRLGSRFLDDARGEAV